MNYSDWHIPICNTVITLGEAHASLRAIGAKKQDIPLIVKLVENPDFSIPGLTLFHGAVDLLTHDYIHILLGRGLLPADEAFVIGYTMGSTKQLGTYESVLFEFITQHLYPDSYKFKTRDIEIFRAAVSLANAADVVSLDKVDYSCYLEMTVAEIRSALGINTASIIDYYRLEQERYPDSEASKRLLHITG